MKGFEPCLFDKLFDDLPQKGGYEVFKRLSLEEMKDAVARDVEALLNNRFTVSDELLRLYPHCQRSLVTYGIQDFSGRSLASSVDRSHICRSLESAISVHEPRLMQVKVSLNPAQHSTGALRFSINAMLVVHPSREPVSFDAMLQPTTLQYAVSKGRRMLVA